MPRRATSGRRKTIVDVAQQAGVSVGTVSRVINNVGSVGATLRERVLEAAGTLGYLPDPAAQSMRTRTTRAVGVMVSDISNPLFSSTVSAAEEVLYRNGYNMVLANSRDRPSMEIDIITLFKRRRIDGMIITLSNENDPGILKLLAESALPTVLLERESKLAIDEVATDHRGGAVQAVKHLLDLKHRRIGLITVTQAALPGRQRAQGYVDAHRAAGVPVDPTLTSFDGFVPDAGYHAAYRMLIGPNPPTALVVGANQMPGVIRAIRTLKISIPRQLSVVQIGDTDLAHLHQPPITAVRWEFQKVGAAAAELLVARLSGTTAEHKARVIVLPTELILRGSCAPPR